ncbi:hypothetical protein [Desulfothermobacter acidiphilus]|uniref:hypothetical protein n=1 Tax=Desulfothermobacter acidiphilus TaxID=1938353 RepID=UPI003F8BAA65
MIWVAAALAFLLGFCLAVLAGLLLWRRQQSFAGALEEFSAGEECTCKQRLNDVERCLQVLSRDLREIREQGQRLEQLWRQQAQLVAPEEKEELTELARRWGKSKGEVELMLRLGRWQGGVNHDKRNIHGGYGIKPAAESFGRDGQ